LSHRHIVNIEKNTEIWPIGNPQNKVFRSVLVKPGKSSTNMFDPNPRGRNEVQKYKPTPYYLTEFDGESVKNNRFSPIDLLFLSKMVFKQK
jgi:hypothetical protein